MAAAATSVASTWRRAKRTAIAAADAAISTWSGGSSGTGATSTGSGTRRIHVLGSAGDDTTVTSMSWPVYRVTLSSGGPSTGGSLSSSLTMSTRPIPGEQAQGIPRRSSSIKPRPAMLSSRPDAITDPSGSWRMAVISPTSSAPLCPSCESRCQRSLSGNAYASPHASPASSRLSAVSRPMTAMSASNGVPSVMAANTDGIDAERAHASQHAPFGSVTAAAAISAR